jgi:hypothetical protein
MKSSPFLSRQLLECERVPASLLELRVKSGAKTPRTPKALRAKFSRLVLIVLLPILFAAQEALACPFCYGAKDGKSTEHMAIAIWFLFGAVLSVIGGIGAFSFHLWRHGRMPAEPHQELTQEDLSKYE